MCHNVVVEPDGVRHLINAGESLTCEFKRASINDNEVAETAVCLANGRGGFLLLGVEDDGKLTGTNDGRGRRRRAVEVEGVIRSRSIPAVDVSAVETELDGMPVIVVEVAPAEGPVGTRSGKYLRRAIKHDGTPECRAYLPHEMMSRYYSAPQNDHAATIVRGVSFNDLDPLEFDRVRQLAARPGSDSTLADLGDEDIARALEVVAPRASGGLEILLGAVLLFGRPEVIRRHVSVAEVAFQETDGTRILANDIQHLPLFAGAAYLRERLQARNTATDFDWGLQRITLPRFPERVIREIVANALVHRDYASLGPVRCELTPDELRVSSPGGLPPGITQANILEESQPRSRILASAFRRAGIVDRSGQGVKIMAEELLRVGRGVPDYSSTTDVSVVARVASTDADIALVGFLLDEEAREGRPMQLRELQILRSIRQGGAATTGSLAEELGLTIDAVRAIVVRAVRRGTLETRGHGRGQTVHLPASFFALTGEADEYARSAIAGQLQQEEMVLKFVEVKGRIARREASELLRLSAVQAGRLLQRMAREGALESRGVNRGAHYVRPGTP